MFLFRMVAEPPIVRDAYAKNSSSAKQLAIPTCTVEDGEQVYLVDVIFELLMFGEIGLKMLISGVYSDPQKVRGRGRGRGRGRVRVRVRVTLILTLTLPLTLPLTRTLILP